MYVLRGCHDVDINSSIVPVNADRRRARFEVDSDGGQMIFLELFPRESLQNAGFSHSGISHEDDFGDIRVIHVDVVEDPPRFFFTFVLRTERIAAFLLGLRERSLCVWGSKLTRIRY